MSERRKVLLHYHVFKNAGTSVDRMLQDSLGDRWKQWDLEHPGAKISPQQMEEFILDQPDLVAVSSHQVVPPVPSRHLDVYPIVFMRHPIDRAYSAYLFEWQKQKGSEQPVGTFDAYIHQNLSLRRRSAIEDFQTLHFANRGYESRWPSDQLDDEEYLRNAKAFLRSVPVLGVVERYAESIGRMKQAWGATFPELSFSIFHANVLQDPKLSVAQKMRSLRQTVDPDALGKLILRNQMDLRLYEYATACFDLSATDAPA